MNPSPCGHQTNAAHGAPTEYDAPPQQLSIRDRYFFSATPFRTAMGILDLPDEILTYILLQYVMGVVKTSSPMRRAARDPHAIRDAFNWLRPTLFVRCVCVRLCRLYGEFRPFQTFVAIAEGRLDNAHMREYRPFPRCWSSEAWRARNVTCPAERQLVAATPDLSPNEVDARLRRGGACPDAHWQYGAPVVYDARYSSFQISIRCMLTVWRANLGKEVRRAHKLAQEMYRREKKSLARRAEALAAHNRACDDVAVSCTRASARPAGTLSGQ
jgi:hypothetical protein